MKYLAAMLAYVFAAIAVAAAAPPIEVYGQLPEIKDVALSPDGKHVAYILTIDGKEHFVVKKVGGEILGAGKGDFKARSVAFADADHAIFKASKTTGSVGFVSDWEQSGALSFNIRTKKVRLLLSGTEDLYPAQSGLGRIVGVRPGTNDVFMPAWTDNGGDSPSYDLYSANLDTGRATRFARGGQHTGDWFVDDAGNVIAREEFNTKTRTYTVEGRKDGSWKEIYRRENVDLPTLTLSAVSSDNEALIAGVRLNGEPFERYVRLGFDGSVSPPLYGEEDRDVEEVLTDINRRAFGVRFAGMQPKYKLNDAALDEVLATASRQMFDASVQIRDWSADFSKLLLYIEGGQRAPTYYVLDVARKSMSPIARSYDGLEDKDVGATTPIEYRARDGRAIPAILTTPPNVKLGAKLPLIVMPHGGPEAYDAIGFHYRAQYFASRGYLIFQPNFRGSAGFGLAHLKAGYGEWGGKMQDDLTDGVEALIRNGYADPERICIVGASYGGYAALAGGAFTPDLYKCVAAIAPVSDVEAMLNEVVRERGRKSETFAYWSKLIGDLKNDKAKIRSISPINAAENFKAPVLLIHGTDDTVVSFSQSSGMESALRKAGKNVTLVKLKGEDHWLSQSDTRLQALKELDAFVTQHIGGKPD